MQFPLMSRELLSRTSERMAKYFCNSSKLQDDVKSATSSIPLILIHTFKKILATTLFHLRWSRLKTDLTRRKELF